MKRIGVVGVGGWGKNLARNYFQIPECELRYVCDLDESLLQKTHGQWPTAQITTDFQTLLDDAQLDAVVIATPAPTHYSLAAQALTAGKDVYVEKPFVLDVEDGKKLIKMADEKSRILMVGHLLEYHPVVVELKRLIDSGELGRVLYIYTQRVNLGTVREDENALWNFAPHDISSILYLLGQEPTNVSARGQSYLKKDVEDVVFLSMDFAGEAMAHVHVSWLDPHKIRKLTIVGDKKMAVFDDLEGNEKLKIYDKGASYTNDYDSFAEYVTLRFGDIKIPYVKVGEPLRIECQHFLECIEKRTRPRSDGLDGQRVVQVLAAAQESLRSGGSPVDLG
ncbi:MAG: Gfo/Idh/MocA family oxidoreductase [Pseudomonadota bacterium]